MGIPQGTRSVLQDTIPGASPGPSSLKGVRSAAFVPRTNGPRSPPRYVHVADEGEVLPAAEFVASGLVLHRILDDPAQFGFVPWMFA